MFAIPRAGKWICRTCRRRPHNTQRGFHYAATLWQDGGRVSAGLIKRARKLARQHKELEEKAAAMTEYSPESIQLYKRINELSEVASQLDALEDSQKVLPGWS
jgi:hypothetical protein